MQRRAREVLTSIAAAGIGGAIGTLIGRRPSRRKPAADARREAVPDGEMIDGMDTSPILHDDVEVIIIEGPVISVPSRATGDDRDDGENWIEDMLERTSNDLPADDPLTLESLDRKR
jgi:hypothetical protein